MQLTKLGTTQKVEEGWCKIPANEVDHSLSIAVWHFTNKHDFSSL